MDATVKTSLNLGEKDVYKVSDAKCHVSPGFYTNCHDKSCSLVDRITLSLVDHAQRDSHRPHCNGLGLAIVHMSTEEAEELQTQLATAITERRQRDHEAQGKDSDKRS